LSGGTYVAEQSRELKGRNLREGQRTSLISGISSEFRGEEAGTGGLSTKLVRTTPLLL